MSENPPHENEAEDHADAEAAEKAETEAQLRDIPPAPRSYQITCKTEKDWRDKTKFWAELFGLVVLIAYTVFTALMYCANNSAATAAKETADSFQKQLGPWISVKLRKSALGWDKDNTGFTITEGNVFPYLIYQNHGSTPALHVHQWRGITYGPSIIYRPPVDEECCPEGGKKEKVDLGPFFPNEEFPFSPTPDPSADQFKEVL